MAVSYYNPAHILKPTPPRFILILSSYLHLDFACDSWIKFLHFFMRGSRFLRRWTFKSRSVSLWRCVVPWFGGSNCLHLQAEVLL